MSVDQPAEAALARRALFPRGLVQPAGGFRFGADTLLLAAFAARALPVRGRLSGVDLGTGCGAASFGLLLLRPEQALAVTGVDRDPVMLAAAEENARALGLSRRYAALSGEVAEFCLPGRDFALMNPPFRKPGTGRACPDEARGRARFEGPGGFAAFAACAARCLSPGGRLFLVHLSERLPELLGTLAGQGLEPRLVLPVQGRTGLAARLALVEARRGGRPGGFVLAPPLDLYGADGGLTAEALDFCPHLGANPRRAGHLRPDALAKPGDAE